ncbi:hypothetical protein SDRG_10442 [Saprolegnia diclina VS20]|uniref:Uncharacterized protein n=1 Tax=Saprolegnia diclina (strain VS20) TaxID=1156394 RepID=T0QEE2_SAPDV|nr:hypothetical protein SDRG_10442 [Saprolegnia diclina VS20]EQC31925.1 hypothetical protein SDRG_10442 [Saprolegnia diclina VS20]|eukprot:XP_008614653.1 hypothetical protein SDRG_10442 [Saprolegnia diclina VS20]
MWFGVSPLRWNRPAGVRPRTKRARVPMTSASSSLTPVVPVANQPSTSPHPTVLASSPSSSSTRLPPAAETPDLGKCVSQTLYGHAGGVCALLASDDRYIVSCSIDMTLRIWSRGSFNCHHVLKGHKDVVCAVALSKEHLLSGSHDHTIGVWLCAKDFRLRKRLDGHSGHVTKVAFVNAITALSASEDHTLRLWDLQAYVCLRVLEGHRGYVSCWLLRLPTLRCWSGASDASLVVWSLEYDASGAPLHTFPSYHRKTVQSILQVDDTVIASASNDGTIHLFDATTLHLLRTIDAGVAIYQLQVSAAGHLVASTGHGHLFVYCNAASTKSERAQQATKSVALQTSQWIPHLKVCGRFAACVAESTVYVVDLETLDVVARTDTQQGLIHAIEWLNTVSLLACGKDGVIKAIKFPHLPL